MFESVRERLTGSLRGLGRGARLTEDNVRDTLRDVRRALLEADVALPVAREFVERVGERAVGREVLKSLTPGQAFVGVVHEELVRLMTASSGESGLVLNAPPPAPILLAGLQGSGKTTTSAKLARWLAERHGRKSLLASCDVYRPAAAEQLRVLARELDLPFYGFDEGAGGEGGSGGGGGRDPVAIARGALAEARRLLVDYVILDTAGRLHVDEEMMREASAIHAAAAPVETLFVADAMTGQDAVNVARAFDEALPLTGVVLTKADGDARGGAALSVRRVTGKPVKFLGTGEKLDGLEPFHPERIASRILGMGDVLTLIEEAERKVDREKADALARKMGEGRRFDLEDLREQVRQMRGMGGMRSVLEKLPGAAELPAGAMERAGDDRSLVRTEAVIDSMTPHERRQPQVIRGSRKRRIAAGAGVAIQDVNRVLKQAEQMQKMMRRARSKGGLARMMGGMLGGGGAAGPGALPGLGAGGALGGGGEGLGLGLGLPTLPEAGGAPPARRASRNRKRRRRK